MGLLDFLKRGGDTADRAMQALRSGNPQAAVALMQSTGLADQDLSGVFGSASEGAREAGVLALAVACLDAMLIIDGAHHMALYNRAVYLSRLGRNDEALQAYTHLINTHPDHADAHLNRGTLLDDQGEFGAASKDYKRAIELGRDDVMAWANAAGTLYRHGSFAEAVDAANHALERDASDKRAKDAKFLGLVALGRLAEANVLFPSVKMVEVTHNNIALRFNAMAFSDQATLMKRARKTAETAAALPLRAGEKVALGWPVFLVHADGERLVLAELDCGRWPLGVRNHNVTFALQTISLTVAGLVATGLQPTDCLCTDRISVEDGALERHDLTMQRVAAAKDGVSGWVIGPANRSQAEALFLTTQGGTMRTAEAAKVRRDVVKALAFPPGVKVRFRGNDVVSVVDPGGKERLGCSR